MIVVLIDTTSDAHLLHRAYEGIEDMTLLVNPTNEEVDKVLKERPNETLMGMGHGCSSGLFGYHSSIVIGNRNIDLLKDRELICIWCNADGFGRMHNELSGFFTSMFISNAGEAYCYNFHGYTDEDIFSEVTLFCERVNKLIKDNTPLNEWVNKLYEQHNTTKGYVVFNYQGLKYFYKANEGKRKSIEYDYIDKEVIEEEEEVKSASSIDKDAFFFDERIFDDEFDEDNGHRFIL